MRIVDEKTLALFRGPGQCEFCKKVVSRREPHHIFSRGAGRLDVAINLVSLCAAFAGGDNCHAAYHNGDIARYDLLAIVAYREGRLQHEIEAEIWRLRRLDKWGREPSRKGA